MTSEVGDSENPDPVVGTSKPRLLDVLGPGLITGAADDDPSGIATYSQAGAQFGFAVTWTMLFSYPLMAAIQEISARIGRTCRGDCRHPDVEPGSRSPQTGRGAICVHDLCAPHHRHGTAGYSRARGLCGLRL